MSITSLPWRRTVLSCLLVVAALPLTACKSDSGSSDSGPKGSEKAADPTAAAKPLTIAYSDWPGWVAWEIGIQKGWFEQEGVAVEFKWFEYVPSMEAFAAGQVDAVTMTNGDMLVTGSNGAPSVGILINDYSNGNDMVVAAPGVEGLEQLRGKQVGVEVGFVSHLLLMKALESAGMTSSDVELKNVPTDQTPQLLAQGEVAAIVAWQPNSGQALRQVSGSKAIFTSANVPGLIYDLLCVNPQSLSQRRDDWLKVAKVWFRIADYLRDEANLDEAAAIMGARVGLEASEYKALMSGTHILGLEDNRERFAEGPGLESLHGSSKVVDEFQVANGVYKEPQPVARYIDGGLVQELTTAK